MGARPGEKSKWQQVALCNEKLGNGMMQNPEQYHAHISELKHDKKSRAKGQQTQVWDLATQERNASVRLIKE